MYPVGTLYAGGRAYFLLEPKPVRVTDAGATFRCIDKTGPKFQDGNWPILNVTALNFAIEMAEDEPNWSEIQDAVYEGE